MAKKIKPIERTQELAAENADLRYRLEMAEDDRKVLRCRVVNAEGELAKEKEENEALKTLLKDAEAEQRLLSAQMDVVRLIFGKGGLYG